MKLHHSLCVVILTVATTTGVVDGAVRRCQGISEDGICRLEQEMTCEEMMSIYSFGGSCCSLSTNPFTSNCVVTVSNGHCTFFNVCEAKCFYEQCDPCKTALPSYFSNSTEPCPVSEFDITNLDFRGNLEDAWDYCPPCPDTMAPSEYQSSFASGEYLSSSSPSENQWSIAPSEYDPTTVPTNEDHKESQDDPDLYTTEKSTKSPTKEAPINLRTQYTTMKEAPINLRTQYITMNFRLTFLFEKEQDDDDREPSTSEIESLQEQIYSYVRDTLHPKVPTPTSTATNNIDIVCLAGFESSYGTASSFASKETSDEYASHQFELRFVSGFVLDPQPGYKIENGRDLAEVLARDKNLNQFAIHYARYRYTAGDNNRKEPNGLFYYTSLVEARLSGDTSTTPKTWYC